MQICIKTKLVRENVICKQFMTCIPRYDFHDIVRIIVQDKKNSICAWYLHFNMESNEQITPKMFIMRAVYS